MQQEQANKQPMIEQEKATSEKKLAGKMVLLVGGLYGRQLIRYLAAQGADLVLAYPPKAVAQAKELQSLVQAEGQTCILIAAAPGAAPKLLVRQVLARVGSLDVFLDLTEEKEGMSAHNSPTYPRQPASWAMLLAAVQHLAAATAPVQERGRLTAKGDRTMLFLGKDLIGNHVISVQDGRILGRVKDVYLDEEMERLTGVYLGGEGFLNRQYHFVTRNNITTLGRDSVLIRNDESIETHEDPAELHHWLRRDDLHGRAMNTAGGTKIGAVDDVILTPQGQIAGFALGRVQVEGPVAEKGAVARQAVLDIGTEDKAMIIDLPAAEAQQLTVMDAPLFSATKKVTMNPETAVSTPTTPYTETKPRESYADHAAKSPYVGDAQKAADHSAKSPYDAPEVAEEDEKEEFKSPYTTPEAAS